MVVPNSKPLRFKILKFIHNSPIAGYPSYMKIYNKELLAIVRCFEQWRLEFKGLLFLIYILTDHKNLQYFITIK